MSIANEVLTKNISWIKTNIEQFSLENSDSAQEKLMLLKPLGELVLTLCLLKRIGIEARLVEEASAWAWKQLQEGNEIADLFMARPDLMVLSSLYASFEELGFENQKVLKIITNYSKSIGCMSVELPAWRKLDIRHSLENLGVMAFPTSPEKGIWLECYPEPWKMSDDIAYAVTHEVFYITDFGIKVNRLQKNIREYLDIWCPAWLDIYTSQKNWDLTAEFIMVMECIGKNNRCDKYIERIYNHQELDGLVPSPSHAGKQFLKGGEEPERERFLSNYHTTLVTTMAMAMSSSKARHSGNFSATL